MFFTRFARLVRKMMGTSPLRRKPSSARPSVENLEAREVPATFTWTGAISTDANVAGNWSVNGSPASSTPDEGDDVIFGIISGEGHADCNGLQPRSEAYNSLQLLADYNGRVTLAPGGEEDLDHLEVNDFVMASGTIDQPTDGTDIVVDNSLNWTGGTINSTDNLANLNIDGADATAVFAPAGGGTMYCGSNINLDDGAQAEMHDGEIDYNKDGTEFVVSGGSSLRIVPGALAHAVLGDLHGPDLELLYGDSLIVEENDALHVKGKLINAGTVTLKTNAVALFDGDVGDNIGIEQTAYLGESGNTYLYGGSSLATADTKTARFSSGSISILASIAAGSDALISAGTVELAGADIYINSGGGDANRGTLTLSGNVAWSAGTYHPILQSDANGGAADLLDADVGTLTISGTAAISPTVVDGEGNPIDRTTGDTWTLLHAAGGITGTPSYNSGIWIVNTDGHNPVTEDYLTAW